MRTISKLALLAMALGLARLVLADESSTPKFPFDIPAQTLTEALDQLSEQARVQVLHRASASGEEPKTQSVKGTLSLQQALERLLAQTGYRYELINERTVRVAKVEDGGKKSAAAMKPVSSGDSTHNPENPDFGTGENSSSSNSSSDSNPQTKASPLGVDDGLEQIIVTAQKRQERLQDVPISISVLEGDALDKSTDAGINDALARVPGVSIAPFGYATTVAVRGVTTPAILAGSNSIAYYVDSTPFGVAKQGIAPDPDAYDLDRIEVLRGPHGTLYGSSALNGSVAARQ